MNVKELLARNRRNICRFTLKRVRDITRRYSQMHRSDKYSQFSSIIWSVWPDGWAFVYELSGCGFESSWSFVWGCFFHVSILKENSGGKAYWLGQQARNQLLAKVVCLIPIAFVVTKVTFDIKVTHYLCKVVIVNVVKQK